MIFLTVRITRNYKVIGHGTAIELSRTQRQQPSKAAAKATRSLGKRNLVRVVRAPPQLQKAVLGVLMMTLSEIRA